MELSQSTFTSLHLKNGMITASGIDILGENFYSTGFLHLKLFKFFIIPIQSL
jgi:hypothetical protein